MKRTLVTIAIATALVGCSDNLLDYRNAEMSNGLIYSAGENQPFSGKVTNVPFNVLPTKDLGRMLQLATNASKDQSLSQLFMVSSIASLTGSSSQSAVLCDLTAAEGYIMGTASCFTISGRHKVMEVDYNNGNVDGSVIFYSLKDESGSKLAEANFASGKMDGDLKIYGKNSGKLVAQSHWRGGVADGQEKIYSDETQELIWAASIVNGKYDGEVKEFDPSSGDLIKTTIYSNGHKVEDKPSIDNGSSCVDLWIKAFRDEVGEDLPINSEQIGEWEEWCSEGKTPNA